MKRLFLLDTIADVGRCVERRKAAFSGTAENNVYIAMRSSVRAAAQVSGIDTLPTTSYFSDRSHKELLEKSSEIMAWLRRHADFSDPDKGIDHAYRETFLFWLRPALHYFLWTIEVVSNAAETHQPEVIVAARNGRSKVDSLYIEPEEMTLGDIMVRLCRVRNIAFEDLGRTAAAPVRQHADIGYFLYRYARWHLWAFCESLLCRMIHKPSLIFSSGRYQMARLADEARHTVTSVHPFILKSSVVATFPVRGVLLGLFGAGPIEKVAHFKARFGEIENKIAKETGLFSHRGVSFTESAAAKVKNNIADYVLGLILWTPTIEKFVASIKPRIIFSNGTRNDDVIIAELCRNWKIPTVLVSHGSHVPPKNRYEEIEWGEHGWSLLRAPFSHVAFQSPLAEAYHGHFRPGSRGVRTGPFIWARPVDRSRAAENFRKFFGEKFTYGKERVILHAGTPKGTDSLRFHVYETPDEYIGALCDCVRAAELAADTLLVIKFRPSKEIGIDDLRTLVPFSERAILSIDEAFADTLAMADLLVSFSSTTIEEALQNRVPVLLYGGDGRYQHVEAPVITRGVNVGLSAVYHCRHADSLSFSYEQIVTQHRIDPGAKSVFDKYIYPADTRVSLSSLIEKNTEQT